jgi:hypothetical protein
VRGSENSAFLAKLAKNRSPARRKAICAVVSCCVGGSGWAGRFSAVTYPTTHRPPSGLPRARRQPEGAVVTLEKQEQHLTDAELEMLFPSVPWRDPVRISDVDGNFGFACRFCIARHGMGCDIPSLSTSAREVRRHIGEHHPGSVGHKRIRRSVISATLGRRG